MTTGALVVVEEEDGKRRLALETEEGLNVRLQATLDGDGLVTVYSEGAVGTYTPPTA